MKFSKSFFLVISLTFGLATSSSLIYAAPKEAKKAASGAAELKIGTKAEENLFDKEKLTVKAGQTVKLTLKNNAKGMQHNLVITAIGAADEVATAGIQAGADKCWLPPDSPKVIAHTRLLNPGESETITFQAPAQAGDYPYICTFPGHNITMKGILQVK